MIETLKEVREALWVCMEHNHLHHGEFHNTVIGSAAAIAKLDALIAQEKAEPVVRYCPDCGLIGDVPATARDCCPDGMHARMVPVNFAKSCQDTFMRAIAPQQPATSTSPLTDEQLRDAFEHHWFLTRGKKKFVHELQRHPDQPQIYVADNANRHWVTWQAAHKIGAKP